MTEVTISEQMTRMTRRAIAIPFQFLCGGLLPTSSCTDRERETWSAMVKSKNTVNKSTAASTRGQEERRFRRMLIKENHSLYKRQENRHRGRKSRANESEPLPQGDLPKGGGGRRILNEPASMAITPNECDR